MIFMSYRKIEKRFRKLGGKVVRIRGSHYQWMIPGVKGVVTVQYSKDIPVGTLRSIEKQVGIKL
ncbi:type II toxin-antitoxin system HicA family toxin [Leptotrichia wadei]|uniref:type II toxin-antitoxin system HicA family toxin n=2 Tax=Leptotrichia TaxID=32067 RepID=UPI00352D88A3